ncbi:MAG: tRNA (5-methylaminomethyl-2-thiouridine)(34)-methyltransferase MnmD [Saprospiraceae bacterium]
MISESIYPVLGREELFAVHTSDGSFTIYNKIYKATYHSIFGAVSESKHTYQQKCLDTQLHKARIKILEFGFGTGLNAFLAFLFSQKHHLQVDYFGLETFPIDVSIINELDYPGYLAFPDKKDILTKMHETEVFEMENFTFHRYELWSSVPDSGDFDCIFFDAFAPEVQPELWSPDMFDRLFHATAPGGCLVTYCAKGDVRRNMEHSGYLVSRIPGAPGKRQMLRAFKPL